MIHSPFRARRRRRIRRVAQIISGRPSSSRLKREIALTYAALLVTAAVWVVYARTLIPVFERDLNIGRIAQLIEILLFIGVVLFFTYGNVIYQTMRIGYLWRLMSRRAALSETIRTDMAGNAPSLTVLIPSYKEDLRVIRQTLLSAALQQYPGHRVVLLIDDPQNPSSLDDQELLRAARRVPEETMRLLQRPAALTRDALDAFAQRLRMGTIDTPAEVEILHDLYRQIAQWFACLSDDYPIVDHADEFFVKHVLRASQASYRLLTFRGRTENDIFREYRRLTRIFGVSITSFERKRFVNLSWEANKAANLNSYIGLMGRGLREIKRGHEVYLEDIGEGSLSFSVPDPDYVITLDADSFIAPDYATRLIHFMEQEQNTGVGVVQTPYCAFPCAPRLLERIAGATSDIQYIVHQGLTRFGATFWVGANAVLRKHALDDICMMEQERGFEIRKYIQDRTVIEDTESTIDLIDRGWMLHNYPWRLAYSATPPDFGALLIQRRRWANGGLLIIPNLIRHMLAARKSLRKLREGVVRFHYLTAISGESAGLLLLLFLPFGRQAFNVWIALTALPYYFLYGRDLAQIGYRKTDVLRVYAFNLMLVPIELGGAVKQMRQAATGRKTPFARTPKVIGRTAAPAAYILAEYGLALYCVAAGIWDASVRDWIPAIFCMTTGSALTYAISRYIGWQASREDVLVQLRGRIHRRSSQVTISAERAAEALQSA